MISSQFKVTIDKNTRHDILGTPEDIEKQIHLNHCSHGAIHLKVIGNQTHI